MIFFARLLSVIALVAMIAAPAMACCLTGHPDGAGHDAPVHSIEASATSCHDDAETGVHHESAAEQSDPKCSGCIDCENATVSQDDLIHPASWYSSQMVVLMVAIVPGFQGLEVTGPVLTTGPPAQVDILRPTPIELKQILLI